MQKILPKKELDSFIESLIKKYVVIAPIKKDPVLTKFEKISETKQIFLEKITRVPVKKFFIPENETLLEFKDNKVIENKEKTKKKNYYRTQEM